MLEGWNVRMLRGGKREKSEKGNGGRDEGTPGCWNAGTLECCEGENVQNLRRQRDGITQ